MDISKQGMDIAGAGVAAFIGGIVWSFFNLRAGLITIAIGIIMYILAMVLEHKQQEEKGETIRYKRNVSNCLLAYVRNEKTEESFLVSCTDKTIVNTMPNSNLPPVFNKNIKIYESWIQLNTGFFRKFFSAPVMRITSFSAKEAEETIKYLAELCEKYSAEELKNIYERALKRSIFGDRPEYEERPVTQYDISEAEDL